MSKIKKGDIIKCSVSLMEGCFIAGCEYPVEKVDSEGFAYVYNDNGELCAIDYPPRS